MKFPERQSRRLLRRRLCGAAKDPFNSFSVRSLFDVASERKEESGSGDHCQAGARPDPIKTGPQFPAFVACNSVKCSMRAMIAWDRIPQIIGPVRIFPFRCLLRTKARSTEVVIKRSRQACLQRSLPRLAIQRTVRDASGELPHRLLWPPLQVEKLEVPVWLCASVGS